MSVDGSPTDSILAWGPLRLVRGVDGVRIPFRRQAEAQVPGMRTDAKPNVPDPRM